MYLFGKEVFQLHNWPTFMLFEGSLLEKIVLFTIGVRGLTPGGDVMANRLGGALVSAPLEAG